MPHNLHTSSTTAEIMNFLNFPDVAIVAIGCPRSRDELWLVRWRTSEVRCAYVFVALCKHSLPDSSSLSTRDAVV